MFSFYFSTAAKLKLIRTDILSGSPASCYDWPEGFSTHYTSCGAFDIQAGGDKVNYDDEGKDIEWAHYDDLWCDPLRSFLAPGFSRFDFLGKGKLS